MKILFMLCVLVASNFFSINSLAEARVSSLATWKSSVQPNLVIYRPADAFALNYRVIVDGKYVGKLKRDRAFSLAVVPGNHIVSLNNAARTSVNVVVAEGGITYVRKDIDRKARVGLKQV